jgi:hypothetical protein
MLDFFGRPISIGDTVICRYVTSSTAFLTVGTVTDFTPKKVKVDCRTSIGYTRYWDRPFTRTEYKDPQQCIIFNTELTHIHTNFPELFV